jgi:hypothetical protein
MHICAAIEIGDRHYNRSYGMSCLKYDNATALYRFYIAFNFTPGWPSSINHTVIYGLALKYYG